MKTHNWTVPEIQVRSHPGLGWLITGILISLMSLVFFSMANGFLKGIRTYFWTYGEGTIISSDLRSHTSAGRKLTSGEGTVTFSVLINGEDVEASAAVFRKFYGGTGAKFTEWASQFESGKPARVYYNRSGELSLGHWPKSYSYWFGIQGVIILLFGLRLIYRGAKQLKANLSESVLSDGAPAPIATRVKSNKNTP